MADDDKKAPENPKGRDKEAEDRVKRQLTQSENVSKTQEKKQDILAKKAEVLNKITISINNYININIHIPKYVFF